MGPGSEGGGIALGWAGGLIFGSLPAMSASAHTVWALMYAAFCSSVMVASQSGVSGYAANARGLTVPAIDRSKLRNSGGVALRISVFLLPPTRATIPMRLAFA